MRPVDSFSVTVSGRCRGTHFRSIQFVLGLEPIVTYPMKSNGFRSIEHKLLPLCHLFFNYLQLVFLVVVLNSVAVPIVDFYVIKVLSTRALQSIRKTGWRRDAKCAFLAIRRLFMSANDFYRNLRTIVYKILFMRRMASAS
jgi:hypothetical protein